MELLLKMSVGMACTLVAIIVILIASFMIYKKRNTRAYHPIIIGLSLFAFIVSITTAIYLFFGEFTNAKCCFNYSDTSVAVISVLVTVLLGWNIWTTLDLKNQVERAVRLVNIFGVQIRRHEQNFNNQTMRLTQRLESFQNYGYAITDFCQVYTKLEAEKKDYFSTYCKLLNALRHFIKSEESLNWYAPACIDNMDIALNLAIKKGEKCDNRINRQIEEYVNEIRMCSLDGFNQYWEQIVELENKRKSIV